MLFVIRVALSSVLIVALSGGYNVLLAQTDAADDQPSAAPTANDVDSPPRRRAEGDFPRATDLERNPTLIPNLPMGQYRRESDFAWVKFSIVLVAFFVWLRSMRLCVDDGRASELDVGGWGARLFLIGFAGIVVAMLLPMYTLGAGILAATCILPFGLFVRWRNARVGEAVPRLNWRRLFVRQMKPFRPAHHRHEAASGDGLGPSSAEIVLLGKSLTSRSTDSRLDDEARNSPGFRNALALIDQAVAKRATDLHVNTKVDQVTARLRIDGQLVALDPLPLETGLSAINVFKVLCDLNIADKRRSQDGSFRADVNGRRLSFRVSSQGTQTGESLSIRILDPARSFSNFSALGMSEPLQERLTACLGRSHGLVLFAGVTGAGKSTTAYAALQTLNSGEQNIVTVEDPIEYNIPSIDQIEVNVRARQTFQTALRSILRQDADIVLVGEIRDEETAQMACQAATTGQLVLSTLHASDAVSAVFRLVELGVDRHNAAGALRAVAAQQLVRKLCLDCRVAYRPDEVALDELGLSRFDGELYQSPDPLTNPCPTCNGRGFIGRTAIFELLEFNHEIRDLVREKSGATDILEAARHCGMTTLWDNGRRLVRDGIVSPQEFHRLVEAP
jgi:general secretion pathway protein E